MTPDPRRAAYGRILAYALGAAWTLPNSAIGLVAGLAGVPLGARARLSRRDRALVFRRWPWGPGGAITFGNVILHTGETLDAFCDTYEHRAGRRRHPPVRLGDHERAHVYQYMALGPAFLPLYLLCGGISVRNPFERAADRYALTGRGWWPFRLRADARRANEFPDARREPNAPFNIRKRR